MVIWRQKYENPIMYRNILYNTFNKVYTLGAEKKVTFTFYSLMCLYVYDDWWT